MTRPDDWVVFEVAGSEPEAELLCSLLRSAGMSACPSRPTAGPDQVTAWGPWGPTTLWSAPRTPRRPRDPARSPVSHTRGPAERNPLISMDQASAVEGLESVPFRGRGAPSAWREEQHSLPVLSPGAIASRHRRSSTPAAPWELAPVATAAASRDLVTWSIAAMFASSWRSPVAGVRSFSRSICSALRSVLSAAVFSSTREMRLVPGIGAMSSPWASSQANATCAGVASTSEAIASTSSTTRGSSREVALGEAGVGLAPVVVGELLGGADRPGEKAVPERRVGHEADAQLAQQR